MAHRQATLALSHIRSLVAANSNTRLSDRHLLERFVHDREEAAFTALVRRHGPLVLRVCRRVLQDWHASEDAFQATFLVLARRAASIRKQQSLSSWLHGVAWRVALKARSRAKKPLPPGRKESNAEPAADVTLRELRLVLDEELRRLPDRYATPLLLCYLEGKTRDEAAQQLGWPLGTFNSRLDRGRELLRGRLIRRGLELGTVLGAAALVERSDAAILSAALIEHTTRGSLEFAAGRATLHVSAQAVALAEGLRTTLVATHWKLVGVAALLLGLLGSGAGVWLQEQASAQDRGAETREQQTGALTSSATDVAAALPSRLDGSGDPLPPEALARIGSIRWRHGNAITFVTYALDGKAVVSASKDGTIRVWNAQTGEEMRRFGKLRAGDDGAGMGEKGMMMAKEPAKAATTSGPPAIALAPDGKTLAFAFDDHGLGAGLGLMVPRGRPDGRPAPQPHPTIEIWDLAAGKRLHQLACTGGPVGTLAFSPDGKVLATRSPDETIRVFDVAAGKPAYELKNKRGKGYSRTDDGPEHAPGLAFSSDGKLLVTGERDQKQRELSVRIWDLQTRQEILKRDVTNTSLRSLVLSPDGSVLAYAEETSIQLCNPRTGKAIRSIEAGGMHSLTFSADGSLLACRGHDDGIHLYDVATGKQARTFGGSARLSVGLTFIVGGFGNPAPTVSFSRDGKTLLAGGTDHCIRFWDVATGKELPRLSGHTAPVLGLFLTPNGKRLISAGTDGTLCHWDTASGKELGRIDLKEKFTYAALSPDGRTAALGGSNQTIRLHDVVADKQIRVLDGHVDSDGNEVEVLVLTFSADGRQLAARGADQHIRVYDVASGKLVHNIAIPIEAAGDAVIGGDPMRVGLAFSHDGQLLASPGPGESLSIIHAATGKEVRRLPVKQSAVADFAFSPDNRVLAVENTDRTVTLWEVVTGQRRADLGKPYRAQEGRIFIALFVGQGLDLQGSGAASALAFSADGRLLAARGADQSIVLYEVATGQELGQCQGHQGAITALAFAADGQTLASGSADTTALIWDLATVPQKQQPIRRELTDKQVETLWDDLALLDGAKGNNAVQGLVAGPEQTIAFLKGRLRPVAPVDRKRLEALLADLGSQQFAVRQKATEELEKIGELAETALRNVLAGQPGLELRQRVDNLLDQLVSNRPPAANRLQVVRALEVLERINTAEARSVLEKLAEGAPLARQTQDARAALERSAKQTRHQ